MPINSVASFAPAHTIWLIGWQYKMHGPEESKTIDIISMQTACTEHYSAVGAPSALSANSF